MLVVLTLVGQLCLFAKDGTVIHQTSFSVDVSGGDDLVAYHTHFINIFGNPEKAYHNCIAVRGASVYVLGPMHLVVSRLLPWKERIQVLKKAGDWMGALNMAMTLYDGQAHGVIDLPRSLDAVQAAIMPFLVELLLAYVDEVFSYISVAFCNQIGKVKQSDNPSRGGSVHSEIKEQYTRVGGVAVEFCVHIKRTDLLFDEIFSKFVAVQQRGICHTPSLLVLNALITIKFQCWVGFHCELQTVTQSVTVITTKPGIGSCALEVWNLNQLTCGMVRLL